MLNAKSVAINVVDTFNDEWVEHFFISKDELIKELTEIINQFDSLDEMKNASYCYFLVREYEGAMYCFKQDIIAAYNK